MNVSSALSVGGYSSYRPLNHPDNCQCPPCEKRRVEMLEQRQGGGASGDASMPESSSVDSSLKSIGQAYSANKSNELSEADKKQVEALKARDTEVRTHEQAHLAAGGSLTGGGASYTYQQGPDGQRYAIGGEVSISMATGSTPQEKISNAQTVQRAALAPSEPSGQDRAVAAAAAQLELAARQELSKEQQAKLKGYSPDQQANTAQNVGQNVDTYA